MADWLSRTRHWKKSPFPLGNKSPLPRLTCSFYTMNTHTVVYFDSFPHTLSLCQKYTLEYQMWINLRLKILPNIFFFCCLSNIHKNYGEGLLGNKAIFCSTTPQPFPNSRKMQPNTKLENDLKPTHIFKQNSTQSWSLFFFFNKQNTCM